MGQQQSGVTRIHELSKSLTLVRAQPGEKILIDRPSGHEYMLISRLAQGDDHLESALPQRASLSRPFLPQLVAYGRQVQGYCSDTGVLHMLFKQPARSLREQQQHRNAVNEWFQEGELLMIAYCTLLALQDYSSLDGYEVTVNEDTLLIQIDGKIILTDTPRYKEQQNRHSLRRICSDQSKVTGRVAMGQLGGVLVRMINDDTTKQQYSESLRNFVNLLKASGFLSFQQALNHLQEIKKSERSNSTKQKSYPSLNETPTNIIASSAQSTPIGELLPLLDHRQPLKELNSNLNNPINPIITQNQGIKSFCYGSKRKESKLQIYKSKFEARKTEAFAEEAIENLIYQESTIRLDEISSIQERNTFKEEQEEESPPANGNILPEGLICYESQQILHQPPVALFNSNRPERLKQLVLNQKGIIYEESADELSSLASQRTHRVRNFSFND